MFSSLLKSTRVLKSTLIHLLLYVNRYIPNANKKIVMMLAMIFIKYLKIHPLILTAPPLLKLFERPWINCSSKDEYLLRRFSLCAIAGIVCIASASFHCTVKHRRKLVVLTTGRQKERSASDNEVTTQLYKTIVAVLQGL